MEPLTVLTLVVLGVAAVCALYLIITSASAGPVRCAPGSCPTSLITGVKDCNRTTFDPEYEVCNPASSCASPATPYALNADGSSNVSGECEPGTQCPCVDVITCPSYIASMFTSTLPLSGAPATQQRALFPQTASYTNKQGKQSEQLPLQLSSPGSMFCSVSAQWLPLALPGCPRDTSAMDYEGLVACTSQPPEQYNPCLRGTLSVLTDNVDKVTRNNAAGFPVACVAAPPCPAGLLSIYNTSTASQTCRVPRAY